MRLIVAGLRFVRFMGSFLSAVLVEAEEEGRGDDSECKGD